ncbi:PrsW family intramembrane metalloprotease [Candidatus Nomurabacteria bacterium]|nr:PrsW family intramembrane metalloprotease [Candidatus Nomurabacteria bacterium]
MHSIFETILFAALGGILPAIIWLWFWLKEDSAHPEPSKYIFYTFIFGMIAVPAALIGQLVVNVIFLQENSIETFITTRPILGTIAILGWAFLEEFFKFIAAYHGGLKRFSNDEPVDMMIYLITAALGFAAVENTLFLIAPIVAGETTTALLTTNIRFVGATLVHVGSSAILGIFLAFSYFSLERIKKRYIITGFTAATVLHAIFNLFIIKNNELLFKALLVVWIVIIIIIPIFEKIKNIRLNKISNNV